MDTIGIDKQELHPDETRAMENFEKNIKRNENRYVARLPWKEEEIELPSNYGLCLGRLKSTLNNLQRNHKQLEVYDNIIKEQLAKNFIEEVDENLPSKGKVIHYLPHHAVTKDSPTTPLRIVFDCSAKCGKNLSLNDNLLSGPNMVPELTKVLMRFRTDRYAISSDISKAFLNVQLHPKDRDATRFLWSDDPYDKNFKVKVYRFKSVLFGATCSQFILNATIKHHLENVAEGDAIHASNLNRNLYVDNVLYTTNVAEEVDQFYKKATEILEDASLELRGWATNVANVASKIEKTGTLDNRKIVPILGLQWDVANDTLALKHHSAELRLFTKRAVLQVLAAQFDPIGLLSPVIVLAKMIMQQIWLQKFGWDDILSEPIIEKWRDVAKELEQLSSITIPRCEIEKGNVTLHAFCDASLKAYGAVVYAVQDGKSTLLFSKTRVTPFKTVTIPKLELTAVVLATRMIKYVMEAYEHELHVEAIHVYSDSQVTLGWIKSNQTLEVYVQNRVNEIRQNLPDAKFHYVPTKENPADMLSRGMKVINIKSNRLWWHGPHWLTATLPAEVEEQRLCRETVLAAVVKPKEDDVIIKIIERSSTIQRAIRSHARLVRCVKIWKMKTAKQVAINWNAPISAIEMVSSEKQLIMAVQKHCFSKEIQFIKSGSKEKGPTLVNQLNLAIRNELVVCVTRITAAEVPDSAKYPILLPSKHHFSKLIIRAAHEKQLHMGVNSTVAYIREKYWLPKARQNVKMIVHECVTCKRTHGVHYRRPPVAPLPAVRVVESRPFANVGVDFAGPYHCVNNKIVSKRWVALFTCASTRAVHIEIAEDLSATAFIQVLHRFASRRSFPSNIISDNGSNFTATAEILKKWQKNVALQNALAINNCTWKFNPSRAPWMGGFFERLIGLTKRSLNKILGNRKVTTEELHTLMCRIEAQLNDRPLTCVSDQLDDFPALTPSMLIYGYRLDSVPEPTVEPDHADPNVMESELLNKRQKHNKLIFQNFMKKWRTEYLLMLRQVNNGSKKLVVPKVGDIVVIHDDCARIYWQLGRIETLLPGKDGHVRVARVKTKNGTLIRPIIKLYPLEVGSTEEEVVTPDTVEAAVNDGSPPGGSPDGLVDDSMDEVFDSASEFDCDEETASSDSSVADRQARDRPRRGAAMIAKHKIKEQFGSGRGNV